MAVCRNDSGKTNQNDLHNFTWSTLDYTVELILAGVPVVLAAIYASWMLNLHHELNSGKRVRLRWRDLSLLKKSYGVALVVYLVVVAYSELSTIIPIISGPSAPFSTELQNAIVTIWLGTLGLLGFGLFSLLRSPIRKTPSQ